MIYARKCDSPESWGHPETIRVAVDCDSVQNRRVGPNIRGKAGWLFGETVWTDEPNAVRGTAFSHRPDSVGPRRCAIDSRDFARRSMTEEKIAGRVVLSFRSRLMHLQLDRSASAWFQAIDRIPAASAMPLAPHSRGRRFSRTGLFAAILALFGVFLPALAFAQTYSSTELGWDPNGTSGTALGGSGTWDNGVSSYWWNGSNRHHLGRRQHGRLHRRQRHCHDRQRRHHHRRDQFLLQRLHDRRRRQHRDAHARRLHANHQFERQFGDGQRRHHRHGRPGL